MKQIPLLLLLSFSMIACTVEKPRSMFAASAITIEAGEQVSFQNQSSHADFFEWDFGDGYVSDEVNPVHTYAVPGTYEVTLTASSDDGYTDYSTLVITVLYPTTLEVTVREYYNEYVVPGASVILYPTLTDWNNETNAVAEGYTDLDGKVVFSHLDPSVYYVDVWETNHSNYQLAAEDVNFIKTSVIQPNDVNYFTAWVDYTGGARKSAETRKQAGTITDGRKLTDKR